MTLAVLATEVRVVMFDGFNQQVNLVRAQVYTHIHVILARQDLHQGLLDYCFIRTVGL
jgi:hypothetical protein